MNCPQCNEPLTEDNTTVAAKIAVHDPNALDLIVQHDDCGCQLNNFVLLKDFSPLNSNLT